MTHSRTQNDLGVNETQACPRCRGHVKTSWQPHRFRYGAGDDTTDIATYVPVRHCARCDIEFLDHEAELLEHDAVCRHLGVLAPQEVRRIRASHGLSRSEFAKATGLDEKALQRWEDGTHIQTPDHDRYLRVLADPEVLSKLQSTTTQDATCGANEVVGLDGCKDGWIAAVVEAGRLTAIEYHDSASKVVAAHPRATVFAVDIPIGLSPSGKRQADEAARKLLRGCASRVFNAPAACVLDAADYEDANKRSKRIAGCGLTQQSFALLPKIREVAHAIASNPKVNVRETHPEICFTKMNQDNPLPSKKTWDGLMLRKALLAEAGLVIPERVEVACRHSADDVVDAVACAWAALQIDRGQAQSTPSKPETINDRPVAIWTGVRPALHQGQGDNPA